MPRTPPTEHLPETVRRIGRVHHVALIVRSIDASLGLWRDALALDLETVMDIPSDGVRIAFLGVGTTIGGLWQDRVGPRRVATKFMTPEQYPGPPVNWS